MALAAEHSHLPLHLVCLGARHLGMEQICFALLAFEHVPVPEELVRVAPPRQHLVWEGAEDADDARQHRGQRVILEEDVPGVQLGDDGSKGPQVDLGVVWQSEHNLGGAVGARLRRGAGAGAEGGEEGRGPRAGRCAEKYSGKFEPPERWPQAWKGEPGLARTWGPFCFQGVGRVSACLDGLSPGRRRRGGPR